MSWIVKSGGLFRNILDQCNYKRYPVQFWCQCVLWLMKLEREADVWTHQHTSRQRLSRDHDPGPVLHWGHPSHLADLRLRLPVTHHFNHTVTEHHRVTDPLHGLHTHTHTHTHHQHPEWVNMHSMLNIIKAVRYFTTTFKERTTTVQKKAVFKYYFNFVII